jgi:hypothetical protein
MSTLNLFPARVPIGLVQPDGTVLMTPELTRAFRALFERVGGPDGMGSDDLAVLAASVAQVDSAKGQAIEDVAAAAAPDLSGQVAALLAEVQDLRRQANELPLLQAELAEVRKTLADLTVTTLEHPARAELAEMRKDLEGIQLLASYQDPYRLDLTRPGPIGSSAASSGAFTTLSASGQITSTLATGTAPFSIASTTVVPNLNVSQLLGNTWAAPAAIGSTTPAAGTFTSLTVTTGLAAFNKGASVNGPATLGATGTTQWSFETPIMRYFVGDGTGYSLRLTKRITSTNTDLFTFTDGGDLTVLAKFGCNGAAASSKITVTGSRGGNAALASLLTAFATFGFITDSTTA